MRRKGAAMGEQREMFDEEPVDDVDVRTRAIEAVGEDGLSKLARLGLTVLDATDLREFEKGMDDSVERARELARASMKAAEMRSMLIEFCAPPREDGTRTLRVVVCDPVGDEEATIRKVIKVMGAIYDDRPTKTPRKARRVSGKATGNE